MDTFCIGLFWVAVGYIVIDLVNGVTFVGELYFESVSFFLWKVVKVLFYLSLFIVVTYVVGMTVRAVFNF